MGLFDKKEKKPETTTKDYSKEEKEMIEQMRKKKADEEFESKIKTMGTQIDESEELDLSSDDEETPVSVDNALSELQEWVDKYSNIGVANINYLLDLMKSTILQSSNDENED
jgi:hypothetical protein